MNEALRGRPQSRAVSAQSGGSVDERKLHKACECLCQTGESFSDNDECSSIVQTIKASISCLLLLLLFLIFFLIFLCFPVFLSFFLFPFFFIFFLSVGREF